MMSAERGGRPASRRGDRVRSGGHPAESAGAIASRLEGDISGYIFKRASPSCGMARVTVCDAKGRPGRRSAGAYAGSLMAALPLLPCEEEGHLGEPDLRESFVERVFEFHRWQRLMRDGLSPTRLVARAGASVIG